MNHSLPSVRGAAVSGLTVFVVFISLVLLLIFRLPDVGLRGTGWDDEVAFALATVACDRRTFVERMFGGSGRRGNAELEFLGGRLIAVDFGEWDGGIIYAVTGLKEQTIIEEKGQGLYDLEPGVVAITGLSHLVSNDGNVWRIDGPTKADVVHLHKLAGRPMSMWKNADGSVTIRARGGDHILNRNSELSDVNCSDV